jgi:septal ring factor EnvC (AmiA/AmiB activator)
MNRVSFTLNAKQVCLVAGLALGLTGCASMDAPDEEIATAQAYISTAKSNDADAHSELAMHNAMKKIEAAKKAIEDKEYLKAKQLAQQAAYDAKYANLETNTKKLESALEEVNSTLASLRKEIDKNMQ